MTSSVLLGHAAHLVEHCSIASARRAATWFTVAADKQEKHGMVRSFFEHNKIHRPMTIQKPVTIFYLEQASRLFLYQRSRLLSPSFAIAQQHSEEAPINACGAFFHVSHFLGKALILHYCGNQVMNRSTSVLCNWRDSKVSRLLPKTISSCWQLSNIQQR